MDHANKQNGIIVSPQTGISIGLAVALMGGIWFGATTLATVNTRLDYIEKKQDEINIKIDRILNFDGNTSD